MKYFIKKSSCVFPPAFVVCSRVFIIGRLNYYWISMYPAYIRIFLHESADDYIAYINLVPVPEEFFKDSERSWLPYTTVLSIATRQQQKGQRKILELKEKKIKNKQATKRWTDWREKKEKKRIEEGNVLEEKKKKKRKKKKTRIKNRPVTKTVKWKREKKKENKEN